MQRDVYEKRTGPGTAGFRAVPAAAGGGLQGRQPIRLLPVAAGGGLLAAADRYFAAIYWTGRGLSFLLAVCMILCISGCSSDQDPLFIRLTEGRTGLHFTNTLREDENANVLNYAYFYNGGGVAIGDINNDGLPDILFTGNMVPNRLFLNRGNFTFEDITEKSGIAQKQGWCTGATMADVNGDGLLDIHICRSGDTDPVRRRNLLYINKGDLTFAEKAESYGLADEGYSTQAAFFDYDKDGDLDMVLINHSLQQYASGAMENAALRNRQDPAFATKLYRNDNGHFTDVSGAAGIVSNVLSFGLGLAVSDINMDGWPDIYVSNDFNEPDHLFLNNRDGTFSEKGKECLDQTSLYSMGLDCADYNNDGFADIMTLDMLGQDNHTQKMHSGAENFDKFQLLWRQGFYYQYSRNMLQRNNGDGSFSEIGQLAGVSNTNWSWSALFSDFDNDGQKDLFITNGYAKDFTDMDFIKYDVSHNRAGGRGPAKDLLDKMPSLILPNYIYRNNGDNTFSYKTREWGFDENTLSSGAAYADLDNDGNMDLVVSNINSEAGIYRNQAAALLPGNHYLRIKTEGSPGNRFGIGAKVTLWCGSDLYYQEQMPVRGFQSSVDPVLNFGTGAHVQADSIRIIWPDDRTQVLRNIPAGQLVRVKWAEAKGRWDYGVKREKPMDPGRVDSGAAGRGGMGVGAALPGGVVESGTKSLFKEMAAPGFIHRENDYNDFAVQPLMPGYLSRQGPCMAKADINKDGREDLFIGGAKGQPGAIFVQQADGSWSRKPEPWIGRDSSGEEAAAVFFDADGDGDPDLYVACGGYEFAGQDKALQDHLYLNDGRGNFTPSPFALPDLRFSKSCVRVGDINGDGYLDVFLGGRCVPGNYPLSPGSRVLLNDGKGRFTDATESVAPELLQMGMVTDAVWVDLNKDQRQDLVLVGEWMPITVLLNEKGKLRNASADFIKFPSTGWWNTLLAADFDGDGDTDLVIGNMGLNTPFRASEKEPVSLYYKDFDGNGILDPILCYYMDGVSYPAVSRDDLMDQLPGLKKKFPDYHSYADARITDLLTPEQLTGAGRLEATVMETVYLENKGPFGFVRRALPVEAQYSPVYALAAADIDHDGKKDLVLAGNNSWVRIRFGRYRANHGLVLRGDGKGGFTALPAIESGLRLREDVRSLEAIPTGKGMRWIFGVNDAAVREFISD